MQNITNRVFKYRKFSHKFTNWISKIYSRYVALKYRKSVVRFKHKKVVDQRLKKIIKNYALKTFGSKAYWPYLALYTEIRGEFVSGWIPYDYFRYNLLPKLNPRKYCDLSFTKTFDYRIFKDFAIKPLTLFISGSFYNTKLEPIANNEIKAFILKKCKDYIVIKEEFGMGGKQVSFIESSDFKPNDLNIYKNYVIQSYVKQYNILNELYPHSVNTFRITTFLKSNGVIRVLNSLLRFGINGSRVDNGSSGGQYIYIDSEGKPSKSAYDFPLGFNRGEFHPNTGFRYADLKIPVFNNIIEECKKAHLLFPYVRLIGWDVCVDQNGTPKLIEWNAYNPSFFEYESVFGPLFKADDIF